MSAAAIPSPAGVPDVAGILADVVAALTAAGVPATSDRRSLNPPAVLVRWPTLVFNRLGAGAYTATIELVCAVPNVGMPDAGDQAGRLLAATRAVWPGPRADFYELPALDGGDPLPAYRMTVPIRVS